MKNARILRNVLLIIQLWTKQCLSVSVHHIMSNKCFQNCVAHGSTKLALCERDFKWT